MQNMGKDSLYENMYMLIVSRKYPKIYLSNLSAQAQKFCNLMKKASLGVCSSWYL